MSWSWSYENGAGEVVGRSETFDQRGDAESWIGESFGDLAADGVEAVRLFDGDTEVYGPMSLLPE